MKKQPLPELINRMDAGATGNQENGDNFIQVAISHPVASLLAGLRFLTIIPVSWKQENDSRFFKASLVWFPFLGLCVGGIAWLLVSLCIAYLPASVTAVFAMILLAGISGCLHLDGLADSFDGLLSSRPRIRALEIMRDSHVGAMGVLALIFVLLGKYAALSSLSPTGMLQAVILIPLAGRTAIIVSMAILPYARSGDGLGLLFYSSNSRWIAFIGSLFCLVIALFFSLEAFFIVLAAILIPVALFGFWCNRKLGGATGDTLGAVCELTEFSVAIGFSVLYSIQ